jgi:hypothetical protein
MLIRIFLLPRACWACGAVVLWAALPHALGAQDIRDVVREHLDQELEHKPDPPPKPRPKPAPAPAPERKRAPRHAAGNSVELRFGDDADEPAAAGPALPQRVLEPYLQLDVTVGGGYRGWLPQQFPHVKVAVGTYYVWNVNVRAKLFKFLTLHRGYYESNGLAGPRTEEAAVAAQVGSYIPKAAWVLGVLGFPWFKVWEPILRYESRAFHTEARPRRPVCLVTDAVASDLSSCERTRDELRVSSGFETFVAGVRYDQGRDPDRDPKAPKLPPLTFGIGLLSYRKPYQVNVNGNTLDGYLFDGRFRGAGLQLGVDFSRGPDKLSVSVDAQIGLGEVRLTNDLSLNALAPEDWWMGYVVGNANLSYAWPVYRGVPTSCWCRVPPLAAQAFSSSRQSPIKAKISPMWLPRIGICSGR